MEPLEVEDEFYSESSQWEAEEGEDEGEEQVKNPPPTVAPIAEKVASVHFCPRMKVFSENYKF